MTRDELYEWVIYSVGLLAFIAAAFGYAGIMLLAFVYIGWWTLPVGIVVLAFAITYMAARYLR